MYPLVQIGPFRLSSGGLVLLMSIMLAGSLMARIAKARDGEGFVRQVDSTLYPAVIGAVIGARVWYGVFNWDLYGRTPRLFWQLQVSGFAWPGALLGGLLAGYVWTRWRSFDTLAVADAAALALPVPQALASVGLLLSGEAFGVPTTLPWGVSLFGTTRHPTQIYLALAALLTLAVVVWLARRNLPAGGLMVAYLGMQGVTLLVVEALRADSLVLPGGIRAAQVVGLGLLVWVIQWRRQRAPVIEAQPAPVNSASNMVQQEVEGV